MRSFSILKTTRSTITYVLLTLFCLTFISNELEAQRRSTSRRSTSRTEEKSSIAEQWFAIHLGNVQFGSGFSISTKFSYGFEFEKRFSVGANAKIFYDFINRFSPQPDINLFSYGASAFGRVKIVEEFYAIGEYGYTSFDRGDSGRPRENILYPSVGAGYKSGMGDWSYGLHIMYPLNDLARDYLGLEYWIDFNYKF